MSTHSRRTKQRRRVANIRRILGQVRETSSPTAVVNEDSFRSSFVRNNSENGSYRDELSLQNRLEVEHFENLETCESEFNITEFDRQEKNETVVPLDFAIRAWTVQHNIKQNALKNLLKILNSTANLSLPTDPRTLMKTPRKLDIVQVSGGSFFYFGIISQLRHRINCGLKSNLKGQIYQNLIGTSTIELISLTVGIDGIPVSNSSNKQFWPILGLIDQSVNDTPFSITPIINRQI